MIYTQFCTHLSSVETGVSSMIDKSLKIKTSEDLSYDIHLGDMHATCVATFVYGTPFADIAKVSLRVSLIRYV